MKRISILLLVLCALSARADYITINATFTNRSLIGSNFVVSGAAVVYTNAPLNAVSWIVTNSAAGSATGLVRYLGANYPKLYARLTTATNVAISGTDLQFSFPGNAAAHFGFTTTNTLTPTNGWIVSLPFSNNTETNKTNTASELALGISLYSTQAIATNAAALSNYLSLGPQPQTFSNKVALNTTNVNGMLTNSTLTNVVRANVSAAVVTNLTGLGGSISNTVVTNAPRIVATDVRMGTLLVSNGATITNLSAPGAGASSQQIGASASAAGDFSLAFGVSAAAVAYGDTALGNTAVAGGGNTVAVGAFAQTDNASNAIAIGYLAVGTGTNATAIGPAAQAIYNDSTAIGYGAETTAANQMRLGYSATIVSVPGVLRVDGNAEVSGGISNIVERGTNSFNCEVSFVPRTYATAIAGYVSAINLGTNQYIRVTGASGALTNASFKGGYAGLRVLVEVVNPGLSCVLLDHSAIGAPTAAEKINTGTGALVNMTNSPAVFELMHNGTEWVRLWNSN